MLDKTRDQRIKIMRKPVIKGAKTATAVFFGLVFVQICSFAVSAQTKPSTGVDSSSGKTSAAATDSPKVTQIDAIGLKNVLKPNGKPLLVNFWATWCDPCREEFPDLVKLDADYKGKIDFITISLDDLAEIGRDVPKFLKQMKAEMPAYLLKVQDESAAIASITKDWQGGLPFTILYNEKGEIAYFKQGKIKPELVRAEIDKLIVRPEPQN
jgi:thiol-disulfide isomerase/thioredoxin